MSTSVKPPKVAAAISAGAIAAAMLLTGLGMHVQATSHDDGMIVADRTFKPIPVPDPTLKPVPDGPTFNPIPIENPPLKRIQ